MNKFDPDYINQSIFYHLTLDREIVFADIFPVLKRKLLLVDKQIDIFFKDTQEINLAIEYMGLKKKELKESPQFSFIFNSYIYSIMNLISEIRLTADTTGGLMDKIDVEILEMLADGLTTEQICKKIGRSMSTLYSRLNKMRQMYGATSVSQLMYIIACQKVSLGNRISQNLYTELSVKEMEIVSKIADGCNRVKASSELGMKTRDFDRAVSKIKIKFDFQTTNAMMYGLFY